jgi:hypothetical protein
MAMIGLHRHIGSMHRGRDVAWVFGAVLKQPRLREVTPNALRQRPTNALERPFLLR